MKKFIAGLVCGALTVLAIHHPAATRKVAAKATELGGKGVRAAKVAIAKIQK